MQATREKRACLDPNTTRTQRIFSFCGHRLIPDGPTLLFPVPLAITIGVRPMVKYAHLLPFSSLASQVRRGSLFHTDLSSKSSQWKPATNEQSSLWMAGSTTHLCIWSEDGCFNQGGYQGPCRAPYKQESAEGAVSLLCNSVVSAGPSLKRFANSGGRMKCAMS